MIFLNNRLQVIIHIIDTFAHQLVMTVVGVVSDKAFQYKADGLLETNALSQCYSSTHGAVYQGSRSFTVNLSDVKQRLDDDADCIHNQGSYHECHHDDASR